MNSAVVSNRDPDSANASGPRTYHVQYSISQYTFPAEPSIDTARLDEQYLHVNLVDERVLSIPLKWIPTLLHADPGERQKFTVSEDRSALIWDPEDSGINETLIIDDYVYGMERQ